MEQFFTREKANEGVDLPLYLPNGELSEYNITVRGIDSDAFREAETTAKRKAIDVAQIKNPDERALAVKTVQIECIASLVAGWNLPTEYTHNNVVKLLTEAPQIADMVNRFAAQRAAFFVKKSSSSAHGQSGKLNLNKSAKEQKPSSEPTSSKSKKQRAKPQKD